MLKNKLFQEIIEEIKEIRSTGFDESKEDFLKSLGISKQDNKKIVKLLVLIKDFIAESWSEYFRTVMELTRYIDDPIIKAYVLFEAGQIRGIDITREICEEECLEKFQEAFFRGLKEK